MDRVERYLEAFTKEFGKGMTDLKESQNRTDAQILELKESQKKTDEQLNRTDEQLRKTIKKLDKVGEDLDKLGIVQGEVAEELFYRNVNGLFNSLDLQFDRIRRNVKVGAEGEYDIVAYNQSRHGEGGMEALREVVRTNRRYYNIRLPEWAVGREVEVIVLPIPIKENSLGDNKPEQLGDVGPLSVLGYAKTFRQTRTTDEWVKDLREGDAL
jgi:vacuolar-type H+-ATPase subunit I/STV1